MNTLKLDLKILTRESLKIFNYTILFIILISSCKTFTVNDYTNIPESNNEQNNTEYELPLIEPKIIKLDNISSPITIYTKDENKELSELPLIEYYITNDITVNKIILRPTFIEKSLPLISFNKEIYKSDIKTELTKQDNLVDNSSVSENSNLEVDKSTNFIKKDSEEVIIKIDNKPVKESLINKIDKSVEVPVTKPIVKPVLKPTKPIVKPINEEVKEVANPVQNIIILDDMDVLVSKSFSIEMDQTGWIYEGDYKDLIFKNKFYTNGKVLFEFLALVEGKYLIQFVKYTSDGKIISQIEITALKSSPEIVPTKDNIVIIPEEVKESISYKKSLEEDLKNIKNKSNPDEIYFKLAEIYFDEGLIKKSKEFYEYVYDNYPLSIYYEESKKRAKYILNNFLKVR